MEEKLNNDADMRNNALKHQKKRRKHKIRLAVISIVSLIIAAIMILKYFRLTKNEYNGYMEKAKVNYKVNLKENEFYQENYLDEKSTIIANLIKDIEIEFKYNLDLEKNQDYTYNYKIIAKTNVKASKKANSIYETTEELVNKETQESNEKSLEINEKVTINYDDYNEKINKFINLYHLDDTISTLELDMYLYAINKYDGTQINNNSKIITLNIPLTQRTIDISIGSDKVESEGKMLYRKSQYQDIDYMLVIGIIFAIIGFVEFIRLIKYIIDTRSAEKMYEQEIKMINFNYKSYIQKVNNEINENDYKVIQINTFDEMLSLRDTIQAPILMYTRENEQRTKFMIINEGMLYIYILGAKEIRNELRAKNARKKSK